VVICGPRNTPSPAAVVISRDGVGVAAISATGGAGTVEPDDVAGPV
jgi:hypothetical protein